MMSLTTFFLSSVVAVHGLGGDPINTWKNPKQSKSWLEDFLPSDVKGARIFTFGYNADVVFSDSTASVWDHSKSLLGSLLDERETEDERQRPIIFIAHSLGGIIVKQALVWAYMEPQYSNTLEHTLGVVFFGTPHRGSDKAGSYASVLAKTASAVLYKPSSKLLETLKTNSEKLMDLTSQFKFHIPKVRIITFYEMQPTKPFKTSLVGYVDSILPTGSTDRLFRSSRNLQHCWR